MAATAATGIWAMRDDFGLGRNMEIMVNMMRELSTQYVDVVSADDGYGSQSGSIHRVYVRAGYVGF